MSYTEKFYDTVMSQLTRVRDEQGENIRRASQKIFDTVTGGGKVYVFGCTHAGILAQEAFYRTGGLVIINPILSPGLTCDVVPITATSALERVDGYAKIIANSVSLKEGDMIFIHSVSGRNNVTVELAQIARERGAYTVAITNIEYSEKSSSRHSSGKRLFEMCDMVIDDCGIFGDAALDVDGFAGKVAPTSTITGAFIVNAIVAETCDIFVKAGIEPPVFMSANIDGGDEYNARVMNRYKDKINYLG